MNNVFTLEVCHRASNSLSPLRIIDRVAVSNIFIKAKSVNNVGQDTGVYVGNAGNQKNSLVAVAEL